MDFYLTEICFVEAKLHLYKQMPCYKKDFAYGKSKLQSNEELTNIQGLILYTHR